MFYQLFNLPGEKYNAAEYNQYGDKPAEPGNRCNITVADGGKGNYGEIDRVQKGGNLAPGRIKLGIEDHARGNKNYCENYKSNPGYDDMGLIKAAEEKVPPLKKADKTKDPQGAEYPKDLIAVGIEEKGDNGEEVKQGIDFEDLPEPVRRSPDT